MKAPEENNEIQAVPVLTIPLRYYFVPEVAAMLRIGVPIVYRLLQEGKLRGIKIGRAWKISVEDVQAYLASLER